MIDKFMPIFFEEYQNKLNYSTTIGSIYKEHIENFLPPIENLFELNRLGGNITSKKIEIINSLNIIINNFNNLQNIFSQTSSKLIDNYIKVLDIYNNIILKMFKIFIILLIVFPSLSLLTLYLFTVLKLSSGQYCHHLFWNINIVIIIIIFILGGLIGIIGVIGNNLIPIISYLLSPEYMSLEGNIFGGDEENGNYINICLNGNGNLFEGMNINTNEINIINNFLKLSRLTMIYEKELNELTQHSQKIAIAKNAILPYIYNPAITTLGQNMIENDYQNNLNLLRNCDSNFNYTFSNDCNKISPYCNIGDLCCKFSPDNNVYPSDFKTECEKYFQILFDSYFDVQDKLGHFNYCLQILETTDTNLLKKLKMKYALINKEMTEVLISIYNPIVGDEGELKDMFNCSYIKRDMINFLYTVHNKFSKSSKKLYIYCIISGIFSYISLLFMIMILYDNIESGPKTRLKLSYKQFKKNRKKEMQNKKNENKENGKEENENKENEIIENEEKNDENDIEIILNKEKKYLNKRKKEKLERNESDLRSSSRDLNP